MSLVIIDEGTIAESGPSRFVAVLRAVRSRLWWIFPAFIALMVLWALFPGWFETMDSTRLNPRNRLLDPMTVTDEGRHWAGTNSLGQDLFSEMVAGARLTLYVAAVATAIGLVIGVVVGMCAGYFTGWVDRILMRLTEAQTAMPMFLVAILLLSMLGPSVTILIVVLPALVWPIFARVVRAETLRVKETTYIEAATATGCSTPTIMFRHVLPNVAPRILVLAVIEVGHVMLAEAGLSFLGVGVQPPETTWGLLIADGRPLLTVAWWLTILPGVLLGITVLSLNMMARQFEKLAGAAG
jgi:peptide/nickel transport system permease protein